MRHLTLLVLALTGVSCSILPEPPPPVRYLVLVSAEELPDARPVPERASDLRFGLGPITLPDYLRRSELVERDGTRLVPSDGERWAEPLERAVERVLAANLAHSLGAESPVPYPWYATERPDVQIEIAFARFERDGSGNVVADADWSVRFLSREDVAPRTSRSVITHPVDADGAASALGLSQALADLALELEAAVREVAGR